MARGINVIIVFLACVCVASAILAPFPHGKTTQYRYRTVVSTSTTKDAVYSSQFAMQGILDVTHDTRDPKFANAFNFGLSDVTTDMHNGETVDYAGKTVIHGIDDAARAIEEPFLIIYDKNGMVDTIKIVDSEPNWSINMKMAMASMLQLDLGSLQPDRLKNLSPHFSSEEKTIYGDCSFTYNVTKDDHSEMPEIFRINKTFSPMNCSGFAVHDFKNVDIQECLDNKRQRTFTEGYREFEIENQVTGVLIKKLVAFSSVRVTSLNGGSYPHFVITNTTFDLVDDDQEQKTSRLGDFGGLPVIRDLIYIKPQGSYALNTAPDVTQGRRIVNRDSLPSQLEKLLVEAFEYMEKNHLDRKKMEWDHLRTINKILHTMSYMNTEELQVSFEKFEKGPVAIKNIFLGVVPQVGTPASCIFTRNIILKNQILALTSIEMLSKLPLSVRVPSVDLLTQMEGIAKLDGSIPAEVRKSGILSFASLIYRTFKYVAHPEKNEILKKYLDDFLDHVKNEPTYEMKIVYLMAIKNVQVGKIHLLLEPIINGSLEVSNDPDRIRLLAIWSLTKVAEKDYPTAAEILAPLMMNEKLPIKLRIAAYEILMNQVPDYKRALVIHTWVTKQDNRHFYNYHYTTLDNIARSYDRCNSIRTIAKSILSTIEDPSKSDPKIRYPLSGVHSIDSAADSIVEAEKVDLGVVVNELTGVPEVLELKHIVVDNDGAVTDFAIKVHIEGQPDLLDLFRPINYWAGSRSEKLREYLAGTAKSLPPIKTLNIDIVLMRKGHVIMSNNYNLRNIDQLYILYHQSPLKYHLEYQNVVFNQLYETQLASDIGVPVLVENRVPHVSSIKLNYEVLNHWPLQLDLAVEFKSWKHGDFSMSVYNPMKDVWHAVRSFTATEINLPFRTIITYSKKSSSSLKLSFPERPTILPSTAGLHVRGRHFVTVDEEGTHALAESCETCSQLERVSDGTVRINSTEYGENTVKIDGTGLKFYRCVDQCEYGYMSENHLGLMADWDRDFTSNISKRWVDMIVQSIMDIRMGWRNIVNDLESRSCGAIVTLAPDTDKPISDLNIDLRVIYEDLDVNETNLEVLHAEKYKVSLLFDMISSITHSTSRSWNFDVDVEKDQGHLSTTAAIKITRKTAQEQDLKICLDFKKSYPEPPADYLKIASDEEINSKLSFTYDFTDKEDCSREENVVKVVLEAQLSDEQKMGLQHDMDSSACSREKKSFAYVRPFNSTPRSTICLDEAIRYTTPRKYVYDVTHKKLSPDFAEFLYRLYTDKMEARETGNFKVEAVFPMNNNSIDLKWMTNASDFTKESIRLENIGGDGRGPVINPLWDILLDNSRFSLSYLNDYINNNIRVCAVYPNMVEAGDGDNKRSDKFRHFIAHQWIFVSGDHVDKEFAIFAKQPRPSYLSVVAFIGDIKVEFYTRESDNILVANATGLESATEKGFRLPVDKKSNWDVIVTKGNDHFVVRSRRMKLTLEVGADYAFVLFDGQLQGHVSGLCGRLNKYAPTMHADVLAVRDLGEF